jgi:hypothetical protein
MPLAPSGRALITDGGQPPQPIRARSAVRHVLATAWGGHPRHARTADLSARTWDLCAETGTATTDPRQSKSALWSFAGCR